MSLSLPPPILVYVQCAMSVWWIWHVNKAIEIQPVWRIILAPQHLFFFFQIKSTHTKSLKIILDLNYSQHISMTLLYCCLIIGIKQQRSLCCCSVQTTLFSKIEPQRTWFFEKKVDIKCWCLRRYYPNWKFDWFVFEIWLISFWFFRSDWQCCSSVLINFVLVLQIQLTLSFFNSDWFRSFNLEIWNSKIDFGSLFNSQSL